MNTTVDSLKALYVALGGTAATVADVSTIPDMIDAITTVIPTAIAAELPKVTSSNNGQVLTVDGGKWKAKALPE